MMSYTKTSSPHVLQHILDSLEVMFVALGAKEAKYCESTSLSQHHWASPRLRTREGGGGVGILVVLHVAGMGPLMMSLFM